MKKILMASILAISVCATTAYAETFTFKSTNGDETQVGGTTPEGMNYGGSYWTGTGTSTNASGKKIKYSYKCISLAQPPRDAIFMLHGSCNVAAEDGNFSTVMGCNVLDAETREVSCVGGLNGETGAYEGRRGNYTNHAKEGKSKGTGQWFE